MRLQQHHRGHHPRRHRRTDQGEPVNRAAKIAVDEQYIAVLRQPPVDAAPANYSPSRADHSSLRASRDVRALGADGRAPSDTGFTLDRTQHDLVGGRGAENAALTGIRFRYGWQMTRDLGDYAVAERLGHGRGFGLPRAGDADLPGAPRHSTSPRRARHEDQLRSPRGTPTIGQRGDPLGCIVDLDTGSGHDR